MSKIAMAHKEDARTVRELRCKQNSDADWKADLIKERMERRQRFAEHRGIDLEMGNE